MRKEKASKFFSLHFQENSVSKSEERGKKARREAEEGQRRRNECETEIVVLRGKFLDREQVVLPET